MAGGMDPRGGLATPMDLGGALVGGAQVDGAVHLGGALVPQGIDHPEDLVPPQVSCSTVHVVEPIWSCEFS